MLISSPVPGVVRTLDNLDDRPFSEKMLGDGMAVLPDTDSGLFPVAAPLAGNIIKIMPHAFVIANIKNILVHIGIDTVGHPDFFQMHVNNGDIVRLGEPVISADFTAIEESGIDPTVVVCALNIPQVHALVESGSKISVGDTLFEF